ncbi:MAG: hypothetical protein ACLR78_03175 [Roseburia sp.]
MTEEQKAGKIFLFCKESSQERIMKCLRDALTFRAAHMIQDLNFTMGI